MNLSSEVAAMCRTPKGVVVCIDALDFRRFRLRYVALAIESLVRQSGSERIQGANECSREVDVSAPAENRGVAAAMGLVDVLVYLVVLGLFVQFLPGVISESFSLTLLTAVLMKLVLEGVMAVKKAVVRRIKGAVSIAERAVFVVTLVLVLPGSKFLVLWLTKLVFGSSVVLGGFFAVTGLVVTLMVARGLVRWVFRILEQ